MPALRLRLQEPTRSATTASAKLPTTTRSTLGPSIATTTSQAAAAAQSIPVPAQQASNGIVSKLSRTADGRAAHPLCC